MQSRGKIVFKSGAGSAACWTLFILLLMAYQFGRGSGSPPSTDWLEMLSGLSSMFALIFCVLFFIRRQVVELDQDAGEVRVANISSFQCYRAFSASEVVRVKYQPRAGRDWGARLYFYLDPASRRYPKLVQIIDPKLFSSGMDCEVMKKVLEVVRRENPEMTIENVPG